MLIQKKYKDGDILCFKLITGDEIVAKLVSQSLEGDFILSKPCTLMPGPQGIGLMQTMISGDINTNVTLKGVHILMHSPVIADIEKHYIKTTTGIQLT